jgi:hypothetical protein
MPKETHQERESNAGFDELDDFMEGLGDGTITVKCTRLDPPLGYCGDFFVTKNNPLTLKEVKRRFGGRVFQLNSRSSNGQMRKQKTVSIDDVPKREGIEISPDGTPVRQNEPEKQKTEEPDALSVVMKSGLPPNVLRQIIPYLVGLGGFPVQEERKPQQGGNTFELMQQQAIMDMMNNQMRAQLEFQKDMQRQRREMEESQKPKNPYSDMEMVFKMLREIQGFKSELGGGENLAADALQSAVGLAETGLSEFLSIKKLQMQAELAKLAPAGEAPRSLPTRSAGRQLDSPRVIKQENDPVQLARQMGEMFRQLTDEERQAAMAAFLRTESLQDSENIENDYDNDTIDPEGEFLDAEDQEIMNSAGNNHQDETDHFSDGEHAAPADNHNPADRQGNNGGIATPTH